MWALPDTNLLEDLGLEVRGQLRVDWQHGESRSIFQLLQPLHDLIRRHLQGQGTQKFKSAKRKHILTQLAGFHQEKKEIEKRLSLKRRTEIMWR